MLSVYIIVSMRDRLLGTLEPTRYRRFLIYVMGPYKAHDIES